MGPCRLHRLHVPATTVPRATSTSVLRHVPHSAPSWNHCGNIWRLLPHDKACLTTAPLGVSLCHLACTGACDKNWSHCILQPLLEPTHVDKGHFGSVTWRGNPGHVLDTMIVERQARVTHLRIPAKDSTPVPAPVLNSLAHLLRIR